MWVDSKPLNQPKACIPCAIGHHVLTAGVPGFEYKVHMNGFTVHLGFQDNQIGKVREFLRFGFDLVKVIAHPGGKKHGLVYSRENKQQHAHHTLAHHIGRHPATAGQGSSASGNRGDQGTFRGGNRGVKDALGILAVHV